MKGVCSQGGLSSADILRTRGVQMWTSVFLCAKNFGFFEIYGVSARMGVSQCGYFVDKGEGVNFSRFCAGLLWTAS